MKPTLLLLCLCLTLFVSGQLHPNSAGYQVIDSAFASIYFKVKVDTIWSLLPIAGDTLLLDLGLNLNLRYIKVDGQTYEVVKHAPTLEFREKRAPFSLFFDSRGWRSNGVITPAATYNMQGEGIVAPLGLKARNE